MNLKAFPGPKFSAPPEGLTLTRYNSSAAQAHSPANQPPEVIAGGGWTGLGWNFYAAGPITPRQL